MWKSTTYLTNVSNVLFLIFFTAEKVSEVETSMANKKTSYEALSVVPTERKNKTSKTIFKPLIFFIVILFKTYYFINLERDGGMT